MAHREKHLRAARMRREGIVVDEAVTFAVMDKAAGDALAAALGKQDSPKAPRTSKRSGGPTDYEQAILFGLQAKPVYQGPVADTSKPRASRGPVGVAEPFEIYDRVTNGRRLSDDNIVERRRHAKIAKRSRKINRARSNRRGHLAPLLWLLAASILIGSALGLSPQARADARDDYVADYGLIVCDTLDHYPNIAGLLGVMNAIEEKGFSNYDQGWIAATSIYLYCPEHQSILDSFTRRAHRTRAA